jgi:hypothetical protein
MHAPDDWMHGWCINELMMILELMMIYSLLVCLLSLIDGAAIHACMLCVWRSLIGLHKCEMCVDSKASVAGNESATHNLISTYWVERMSCAIWDICC